MTDFSNSGSSLKKILRGVPQGFILCLVSFILYINDLLEYLGDSEISLDADNTIPYVISGTYLDLVLTMRNKLEVVEQWFSANNLTVNCK